MENEEGRSWRKKHRKMGKKQRNGKKIKIGRRTKRKKKKAGKKRRHKIGK
jgi:hypothetical protein